MLGWRKKLADVHSDIAEARAARDAADARLRELEDMAAANAERRERITVRRRQNGFGRELEIVVRPKEA